MTNPRPEVAKLPPFLDMHTAKQYFGFARYKMMKLIKEGKIRGYKTGRNWTIPTISVLKYVESCDTKIPNVDEVHI